MEFVVLNNKLEIPIIGFGTFPQKESLVSTVPFAKAQGYRMVDTSDNYLNEEYVGRGLITNTTDTIIVSKFSQPLRTYELEKCFEESEKKLGGRIDIYLLHWPFPYLWKEQWRRMEQLYLSGRCKAIGVCNFDVGYMNELLRMCRVKPAINQFERHPLYQQEDIVELCKKNGIQVMSYSPLARMDTLLHGNSTICDIAKKYGKTTGQVILRWDIDTGCIPIPASSSSKHIIENINVFDFELTDYEVAQINAQEAGRRVRFNPRTRFSEEQKKAFVKYKVKHKIKKFLGNSVINFLKSLR